MRTPRLLTVHLSLAVSATVLVGVAAGSAPTPPANAPPQERQVDAACAAAVPSIQQALKHASTAPIRTIATPFEVTTPGALTARIAFNRAATSIRVAGDPGTEGFGCSEGSTGHPGLGPGESRIVSTLSRTFTSPGRYTLTFTLNRTGRKLVAQLAGAERRYFRNHPHGSLPPRLAVGVNLSYTEAR